MLVELVEAVRVRRRREYERRTSDADMDAASAASDSTPLTRLGVRRLLSCSEVAATEAVWLLVLLLVLVPIGVGANSLRREQRAEPLLADIALVAATMRQGV